MPQFDQDRKLYLESFPSWKTFQTFGDNKDKKSSVNLTRQVSIDGDVYPAGDFDLSKKIIDVNIIRGLEKLNSYGAGVYMTVNETDGKGRKTENITKVRSIFADLDEVPLPKSFKERPSMIVETSPGKHHVYYFTVIDNNDYSVPLQSFRILQESIAKEFGGDPVVKDLPRILRVPGFNHQKKEPFMSRIIDYTGTRFEYGYLIELFPPLPVKQWSAERWQSKVTQYQTDKPFTGSYGTSKGYRNCHVAARIGGALKRGLSWNEVEAEAYKEGTACMPALKESEIRNILKSMSRYR